MNIKPWRLEFSSAPSYTCTALDKYSHTENKPVDHRYSTCN